MSTYKSFETERLILFPTSEDDAFFLLKLFNTPKWIKYIGDRNIRSIEEARNHIKSKITPQLERLGYSNYTVIRKSDGIKLGICGLYDREELDEIDIGFAFLPEYEKKGYAFEAASKVKEIGFKEFGLKELWAITTEENIESQKLLEKIGLKYLKHVKLPNEDEELLLYSLKNDA